ncbi:MAG TPA: GlxA family transcriptional regulator [Acidimicrobiia bacterium]|nr:GlxA family transcriptional regulator [Acidimicrobiia bacterium]
MTRPAHAVVVVAFEDCQLLDLAGPVEVLRSATRLGADPGYEIRVVTPDGDPVRSESGVQLAADGSLAALARAGTRVGSLVVVGGHGTRRARESSPLLADLATVASNTERVLSVCTGAWLLAGAGLLDGYAATTHWSSCEDLAGRHPDVTVHADRIFVQDRDRWTSAGVTAGIDLFLAVVEHDHGPDLAHEVARWLVVFARRPGGQSQFSAQLRATPAVTPSIAELQRWLTDHLDEDLPVDALAARAAMSPRTFARLFVRETGLTPAAYVEELRIEAAQRLLETSDLTVAAVAGRVGMKHAEILHRAFRRRVGTTPDRYRQHFSRRAS